MRASIRPFTFSDAARRAFLLAAWATTIAMWPLSGALAAGIDTVLQKANAYIEAAKSTERAVDSWERYASWVSMKTGPTGKEEYIDYGMYDVSNPDDIFKEVRELADAEPKSAKVETAMARLMGAYEAVAPFFNEASAYYESKGYLADKTAKGRELHTKMVPLAKAFLAEREALMAELRPFVRDVERQELSAMEAADGRKAAWHVGQVMHAANRVLDLFPRVRPQPLDQASLDEQIKALGPDTPPEKFDEIIRGATAPPNIAIDVPRMSEAIANYAQGVEAFESFKGETPDGFDEFKPHPRRLLEMLREFEGPLKTSGGRDFEGGGQMAGQIYEVYIEMLNTSSPIWGSQIRFLP